MVAVVVIVKMDNAKFRNYWVAGLKGRVNQTTEQSGEGEDWRSEGVDSKRRSGCVGKRLNEKRGGAEWWRGWEVVSWQRLRVERLRGGGKTWKVE